MAYSLSPEDLERIRRSIVCLAPRQPAGLDREAAVALLGELQRLQGKDRRVQHLLDQVSALLAAARADQESDAEG
jgi:hypothetical protein